MSSQHPSPGGSVKQLVRDGCWQQGGTSLSAGEADGPTDRNWLPQQWPPSAWCQSVYPPTDTTPRARRPASIFETMNEPPGENKKGARGGIVSSIGWLSTTF